MAIIKCKMCGGELNLLEESGLAKCEFCGSIQTIPNLDDEKKLIQFERAERLRKQCEFDKAAGIYESIVADYRQEAEAYWGLVLCKYGIEYVDDPTTGKKIPTCHRSSFESILDGSDFEQVMENADAAARKVYREEAKQIEEIRKGIIAVSASEEPYDIFICYKESDEKGERTLDSVLAQDVYDALTDKGYRVFFSRISLEDKLGVEYEPYIFAALNSAKVMLAFGTDYEYYNAVWVKNEWSRFLKLMEKDKSRHLIPCFKGIDAYDMPKEFAKLQAQDLGKLGAIQDLLRGIDKLLAAKPAAQQASGIQSDDVNRIYIYNSALESMKSKKVKQAKDAVKKLESLGDWNDAPQQLENAKRHLKKRKRVRTTRRIIIWLLVFAIIGGIAGLLAYDDYSNKKQRYESAVNFLENEDYQNAYNYFVRAENYKDAPEMAAKVKQMMEEFGADIFKTAEELADMGFYMTAGVYLEQASTQNNSLSNDALNQISDKINEYMNISTEAVNALIESSPSTMDGDVMDLDEFDQMAEVMLASGQWEEFFKMLESTPLVDYPVFAEAYIYKAIDLGMLDMVIIEEIASFCPVLNPFFDMHIANSGYIVEMIERQ